MGLSVMQPSETNCALQPVMYNVRVLHNSVNFLSTERTWSSSSVTWHGFKAPSLSHCVKRVLTDIEGNLTHYNETTSPLKRRTNQRLPTFTHGPVSR
jgi:hypothetical protein